MQTMNALASKPLDKVVSIETWDSRIIYDNCLDKVYDKLVKVVKYWTQVFSPYKDILPLIFKFYTHLENKGVVFPSSVESSYSYLLK